MYDSNFSSCSCPSLHALGVWWKWPRPLWPSAKKTDVMILLHGKSMVLTGGATHIALGASLQHRTCFRTMAGPTHHHSKGGFLDLSCYFSAPA